MTLEVRLAQFADVPALNVLIERSARQLSIGYYTAPQIEAVVRHVFGVDWLDPAVDAAKIRAFFVAPECARRGVGRQLLASCQAAVRDAGYSSLELMATLPGVPFYAAPGFKPVRDVTDVRPDGTPIEFVHMQRPVTPE